MFSAQIVDKLDSPMQKEYWTVKMTSDHPLDFEEYSVIGKIPENACWFANQINQSAQHMHYREYIRLKCQQCKKPVPFVLRGESGCRYIGKPSFMESYDYTCKECISIITPE